MKKNALAIIAVMACVVFLTVSNGWAQFVGIDGGYVSSSTCGICHPTVKADFDLSGHPYKYRTTGGADCGAGACDAISNILPNPAIAGISTLSNDALVLGDGSGYLDWSVINYIIGGFGWKARYGILDATDADLDGVNDSGFVWTGNAVQWNVFGDAGSIIRNQWSNYHGGEDKAYNCGICHNTNGTRDLDNETRTEPWASNAADPVGYTSQWTFDGVQCEACHGPGETHANDPFNASVVIDTTAELCGQCHQRSGADLHGADTSGGFTKHHEQYNELVGNFAEPGVHASLTCVSCHDPHKRSHTVPDATATVLGIADNDLTAEERGAVVSCAECHSKAVRYHADIQCIDCHMAESTKSATLVNGGTYGKMGDVKSHITLINTDPLAEDTNASPNSATGTNVAHNYISLNYACGKCHDSALANYDTGTPALTMEELGDYANQIHTSPVPQRIGFDDKEFNDLTEAECRTCHENMGTSVPDRHHMIYGAEMPEGECSATTDTVCQDGVTACNDDLDCDNSTGQASCDPFRACYTDADCEVLTPICSNSGDPCVVAEDCPRQYQHPECTTTPYCAGTSAASNIPGSQNNGGVYGCLTCHEQETSGGTTNFLIERDCNGCHIQLPNSPTVHHLDEAQVQAKDGNCVVCHGDIVDDMDDGHIIPTYTPSLVTPEPVTSHLVCNNTGWGPTVECTVATEVADCGDVDTCVPDKADTAAPGACNYCHDAGTDVASGVEVVDNHDTHHGTGVYKDRYGNTADLGGGAVACDWCHYQGNPHNPGGHDPESIRTCEGCHGMEALHSIQADSDGNGIVVGGELAGYGHVGEDTPGSASDCWGCHGFSMGSASAPGSEIIAPTISSATPDVLIAGTDASVTIAGNAFTNDAYTAVVELTPVLGGDVIVITPDAISVDSITATINVPAGVYALRANKSGVKSGAVVIIAKPEPSISIASVDIVCGDCDGSILITGSGFGDAPPAGVEEYINVMQDDVVLTIVSWTDTQIQATGASCDGGTVTVNALMGSATK